MVPFSGPKERMPELIATIGNSPERYEYECCTLERRGFLSMYSFAVTNHMPRHDLMDRGTDAVVVLPADFERRELYMIEQPRHIRTFVETDAGSHALTGARKGEPPSTFEVPSEAIRTLELPAGLIDEGETPEAAAVRELKEETGISVPGSALIRVAGYYPSVGSSTEFITGYIARLDAEGAEFGQADGDGNEHILVWRFGFDEAFAMLENGRVRTASCHLLLRELKLRDRTRG